MILIIGCNGFIGLNLTKYFLEINPNEKIIGVGRNKSKIKGYKNFQYIEMDILKSNIFNILQNVKIQTIIFLAADAEINKISKDEKKIQINNNINLTKKLIHILKEIKPRKVIYFSTVYVYSENKKRLSENSKTSPSTSLGKSKIKSEKLLRDFSFKNTDISFLILRLFTVYGKNMRKSQFLYEAIKKLKSKKKEVIFYNPNTFRNFIHVKDVSQITYNLYIKKLKGFKIINIASKNSTKIKVIINIIKKYTKIKKIITYKSNQNNNSHFANTNKLFGFVKNIKLVKLEKGIKELI